VENHPSGVGKSSTRPAWLGLRRGMLTCVGWQVTLCDPIRQVTLRSSELYAPLPFYILSGMATMAYRRSLWRPYQQLFMSQWRYAAQLWGSKCHKTSNCYAPGAFHNLRMQQNSFLVIGGRLCPRLCSGAYIAPPKPLPSAPPLVTGLSGLPLSSRFHFPPHLDQATDSIASSFTTNSALTATIVWTETTQWNWNRWHRVCNMSVHETKWSSEQLLSGLRQCETREEHSGRLPTNALTTTCIRSQDLRQK